MTVHVGGVLGWDFIQYATDIFDVNIPEYISTA